MSSIDPWWMSVAARSAGGWSRVVTMYGDLDPPAVFAQLDAPTPAATIEYSIQIHDHARQWTMAPGELLATRIHTFHSHHGFAVEDGSIHRPDGSLLATVRQTRLSG